MNQNTEFLQISFGYSTTIVVEYKAGLEIIKNLENAFLLENIHSTKPELKPMCSSDSSPSINILGQSKIIVYEKNAQDTEVDSNIPF